MQRMRGQPALPHSYDDISLTDDVKNVDGVQFVHMSGGMMFFGKGATLELLKNADVVYMDGTFFACPLIFRKLYTFHVLVSNHKCKAMVCSAYVLMQNQTQAAYVQMLQVSRSSFHVAS